MHLFIPIFTVLLSSLFKHTVLGQFILSAFAGDNCISGSNSEILAQITDVDVKTNNGCMVPGQFRSVDFRSGPNTDVLCTLYADASCNEFIMALEGQGCQPVLGKSILCFRGVSEYLPVPATDVSESPTTVSSALPDVSISILPPSNVPQPPVNHWENMTFVIRPGPAQYAVVNSLTPKGGGLLQHARL
jgi:hypothetical protein